MKDRAIKRLVIKRAPYNEPEEFLGVTPDDEQYLIEMGFTVLGNGDILCRIATWEGDSSFVHVYPHDQPIKKDMRDTTSFAKREIVEFLDWPQR